MFIHRRQLLTRAGLIGAALVLPRWLRADDETSGWKQVLSDQGISVWNRAEPDRDLPVFKGIGAVDAGLFDCLAVLDDTARQPEWMYQCASSKILKQLNEFDRILYNRTDAPWPVSDRDVVLHATVEASLARKEVISRFSSIQSPLQGPVDGVVRMPRLRGLWKLSAIDERRTRVVYQIDADPGGSLPGFLVERASRKLPLETIVGMRRHVTKMRGRYAAFLQRYDPAAGGKIPEQFLRQ